MRADELLYPPGTLVANWYTISWYDLGHRRMMVKILRVTDDGYYQEEDNVPIAEFNADDLEPAVAAALRWIKQHGYIHDETAEPRARVPRKGDVVRAGLRKVSQ